MHHIRPSENVKDIKKVTWIGFLSNIILSFLKILAGLLSSSRALVADGIHSFSDISTDIAILIGVDNWSKPADDSHPYGHKKIETLISAVIGFMIALAGFGIAYCALMTIQSGAVPPPRRAAFFIAFISIISKEFLYRKTLYVAESTGSEAIRANALHHRTDALSSIPVALAIAVSSIWPSLAVIDSIGAIIVAVFVILSAWHIIYPALKELVDSGPPKSTQELIRSSVMSTQGVMQVHALRSRKMGSEILVDMHILVNGELTVKEGHDIAENVKSAVKERVKNVIDVTVHVEPWEK